LPETKTGNIIVFTGNGKGKTTAALGTSVRAAGHNLRVLIVFFMKGARYSHGEFIALENIKNISLKSFGQKGWVRKGKLKPEDVEKAVEGLEFARLAIMSSKYDLVVLDEINPAVETGLIKVEKVCDIIKNRPKGISLILTGRNADPSFIELADVVTEMKMIKHPYDKGTSALIGLDY
jgi:cob(I)alamin adenosyltransferase